MLQHLFELLHPFQNHLFVEIWLALTGVTNSQIAPFYALDGIFFPAHGRQLY